MNWLKALPLQLALVLGTVGISFIGGCQFGQRQIDAKWKAERSAQSLAVDRQAHQAAETTHRQFQINQEISDELKKKQAALASSIPVVRDGRNGMFINSDSYHSPVPEVPRAAARVDDEAAYVVPDRAGSSLNQDCERLNSDAALTTWMVLEFQKWHVFQKNAWQQVRSDP